MSVTPEHEALHRIFQDGRALFAHAMARALNIETPVPVHVGELSVDFTEFKPVVERRADSVLKVEFRTGCRYRGGGGSRPSLRRVLGAHAQSRP